jgi:uncharacterized membrane protein YjfL (UPF0719 family)
VEDSTIELVGQVFAYSGVGLVILMAGFFVVDVLTPGNLGKQLMEGNPNAAVLVGATLASLGLVLWFAIYFTGAGWDGLDECAIFGIVGVIIQGIGFFVLDLVTPGKLGQVLMQNTYHRGTTVSASLQFAVALIVSASLT